MLVSYIRSSSYVNYEFCEMQYFMNYVLGWQGGSGLKAEQGTVVHKVLEILALCKMAVSEGLDTIEDGIVGELKIPSDWLIKSSLTA